MFNPLQFSDIDLTSLYKSLNPSINPNPNLYFPQPILPSESPSVNHALNPPVTHPHGLNQPDLSIYGGFEEKTSISDDPDEDSRIQAVEQSDPKTHDIASSSLNENPMVTTSLHAPEINTVANNITKIVPRKTATIQSIRCEICDIECNSSIIYERHLLGRRHKKKSEMCISPATTSSGASELPAFVNLEMKRQKLVEGNETVIFMRFCTTCNTVCNSQEMFEQHLAGKNHANQARKHTLDGMESSSVAASSNYVSGTGPEALPKDHCTGLCETNPNNTRVDQAPWCEVCGVYCTSNDDLMTHKAGKKHLKAVEKLRNTLKTETVTPAPVVAPVTKIQGENDALKDKNVVESRTPAEDSDKKKRKIIEIGADGITPSSISGISMMVLPENNKIGASNSSFCEVCNISCTCNGDLIQHRLGKRHLKNLVRLKIEKKSEANLGEINEQEPRETVTPAPTVAPITEIQLYKPMKEGETDALKDKNVAESGTPVEDSHKKKRKIIEIGADGIAPSSISGISLMVLPENNKIGASSDVFCEVCNISCTHNGDLIRHRIGKRHLKNLAKLKIEKKLEANLGEINENEPRDDPGMKKPKITDGNLDSVFGSGSNVLPRENQNGKCEIYPIQTNAGLFDVANPCLAFENNADVMPQDNKKCVCHQFVRCEICDILCTSIDNFNIHKLGKKHLKMEKLKNRETRAMTICDAKHGESLNMEIENAENSVSLEDDLETKKQKMMEVGSADGEDVKVCTVCNVVCNSQSVMDSHLVGKKHAKMMKKRRADEYMATVGP